MSSIKKNIRPYYTIEGFLGSSDVSAFLNDIIISNAIGLPYQNLIIDLNLDTKDIDRAELYGEKDLKLIIRFMTEDVDEKETTELKLIILDTKTPLNMKIKKDPTHPYQDKVKLVCVVKEPFEAMVTTVGKLFNEKSKLKPIEMLQKIIDNFLPDVKKDIKTQGQNEEIPYQFIVPTMTFNSCVKFLHGIYPNIIEKYGHGLGLYKGPLFYQCHHFENTFMMWDLTERMKDNPEVTIYHISEGESTQEIMTQAGKEDDIFYTYLPIKNKYIANSSVINKSYNTNYLFKPSNKLFEWKEFKTDEIFKERGVKEGDNLFINESVKKRSKFDINNIGVETSDFMFKSIVSSGVSKLSHIEINLNRNLYLTKLSKVGVPMELKPSVEEYLEFQGKYIVNSSKIHLMREKDTWVNNTTLTAFRSNLLK